jgi:putative transposase
MDQFCIGNLIDQSFIVEAPNEKWAADTPYVWTAEGWLYLAVILDQFSWRRPGFILMIRSQSDSIAKTNQGHRRKHH